MKEELRKQKFKKLSSQAKDKHRSEFDGKKDQLRKEWAAKTGQEWPVYKKNYYNEEGKIIKKQGKPYDGHHIIPVSHGGPNEWWNIHPAHFRDEHPKIHGKGSIFKEIFENRSKKE